MNEDITTQETQEPAGKEIRAALLGRFDTVAKSFKTHMS